MTAVTSRRSILAGAASAPVLAFPAIAVAGPDPVFVAIKEWRKAHAYFGECLERKSEIDEAVWAERDRLLEIAKVSPDGIALAASIVANNPGDPPDYAWYVIRDQIEKRVEAEIDRGESERLDTEGGDREREARERLFDTVPTTAAGALAMIKLLTDDHDAHESGLEYFVYDDAIAALQSISKMLKVA